MSDPRFAVGKGWRIHHSSRNVDALAAASTTCVTEFPGGATR